MTRPSKNTDQRLIETGREMFTHSGLGRVNLRQVAAKAKVNLGMFHYHFKTKDQFVRAVLQDCYEKFFRNFSLKIEEETSPLEKLRKALFAMGQFTRDNRRLFLSMLQDVLEHNRVVVDFARDNFRRHGLVIVGLVRQCQREGSLEKMPLLQAMSFLMSSVNATGLMVGVLESAEVSVLTRGFFKGAGLLLLTDRALRHRIEMALRGLGAQGARS